MEAHNHIHSCLTALQCCVLRVSVTPGLGFVHILLVHTHGRVTDQHVLGLKVQFAVCVSWYSVQAVQKGLQAAAYGKTWLLQENSSPFLQSLEREPRTKLVFGSAVVFDKSGRWFCSSIHMRRPLSSFGLPGFLVFPLRLSARLCTSRFLSQVLGAERLVSNT